MNRATTIGVKYHPSLARIFSPIVIDSLLDTGKSPHLSEVAYYSGLTTKIGARTTFRELFEWLYQYLLKNYRSEYIYKNVIANKILLGRHSLNTAHMLTEFRVANCKADVVILNGSSTAYEIKSEYDSLDRLPNQVASYSDVFDRVYVVTSKSQTNKIERDLPSTVGIMVLTPRNTISTIREATSLKDSVKPEIIFDSLTKKEYISIIKRCFGYVPEVPNTYIYRECKNLFSALPPEVAHNEMVLSLSKRGNKTLLKNFVESVPTSLKAYAISTSLKKHRVNDFSAMLETQATPILSQTG